MKTNSKNSGYSMIEVVIYVAILSVVYFLIVSTLLSFNSSYRNIVALRKVDNSGINAMERMTRDIRWATNVDTGNSTFNNNSGVLTMVATANGISTTTKFYLDSGVVKVDINGSYYGPLTLSSANVSKLSFSKLDSGISSAIKIDMTVSATSSVVIKTKNYHSTILIKGL